MTGTIVAAMHLAVGYLSGQREPAVNRLRELRRFESFSHHEMVSEKPYSDSVGRF